MDDAPTVVPAGLPAAPARLVSDLVAPNAERAYRFALEAFDAAGLAVDVAGIARDRSN